MRLLLLLALLTATGCASTLSTMQTAKPLARGQFQVSGATGAFAPVGQLGSLMEQGIAQGKAIKKAVQSGEPYRLPEEDAQRLLGVGLALAVAPPGASNELMVRAGLLDSHSLDVGLRLSSTSLRFDGKVRLAHGGIPRTTRCRTTSASPMIWRSAWPSPATSSRAPCWMPWRSSRSTSSPGGTSRCPST
ncbi:hypothetical protein ACN28S_26370 [Cystobacter fuscus]